MELINYISWHFSWYQWFTESYVGVEGLIMLALDGLTITWASSVIKLSLSKGKKLYKSCKRWNNGGL